MKYMLLLSREEWEELGSEEQLTSIFARIGSWFGTLSSERKLIEGHHLEAPDTAVTVVVSNGNTQVSEGPYSWSVEPLGRYGVLEVKDRDEAIAIAKTYPSPHTRIEIRRILEHGGGADETA